MTFEDKVSQMKIMLGDDNYDDNVLGIYLRRAKSLIQNKRFPYGEQPNEIEPRYDQLHIELAIALFNEKGAEGQKSHNENGVQRTWRSKDEIMGEITPYASVL